MQVIPIESRQLTQFANQIREGVIKSYRILEGKDGPDNFSIRLVNIAGKYYSPRHRHNFDQVRYQIAGEFDYDADGRLRPGCAGYFPEGVRYGPQNSSGDTWNVLVQFGGASGSGYTAEREEERGAGELKAKGGVFEKGVYTEFKPDGTKVNKDAYEAIWEHIHGKPLVYPKARYERPILMNTANYDWLPHSGQPGVAVKSLGVFSERKTRLLEYRVDAGASLVLEDNSLYFVLSGAGEAGGSAFLKHTTIRTEPGESGVLAARDSTQILHLGLPSFNQ